MMCIDMFHKAPKQAYETYSHMRRRLPLPTGVITTFLWMRNIQINTSPNKNELTGGIGNDANSVMFLCVSRGCSICIQ